MNLKNKKLLFSLIFIFILIALVRLFGISKSPASLYWEEAALGYDAYSILKTGKDLHGYKLPVVAFESFGDYKPSGYFYFTALSEKLFGLTELAVRLPSILAGFVIIIASYLLSQAIFKNHKNRKRIGLFSAILVGFSPWAFQFSRAAFEANLATAFLSLAIWLLLTSFKNKKKLFISVIFFSLSLYTYHSARVFVPLILAILIFTNHKKIIKNWKTWIVAGLLGVTLTAPILLSLNKPEVKHRFQETSAFNELAPIQTINQLRSDLNNSTLSRIVYHRYWYYANTVIKNISSNFNLNYLFINGDENKRHSTGESGIFYPLDALLLIAGILAIIKIKSNSSKFLLFWWLAALIPASLTKTNPHALRTLVALPAPQIIAAFGVNALYINLKKYKTLITVAFILLYSIFVFRHFFNYFNAYTKKYSSQWQYGYKELMIYIKENQDQYDQVYITRQLGRPSTYYFFYNQIDPKLVQAEELSSPKDQGERLGYKNINFNLPDKLLPNSLVVTTQDPDKPVILDVIKDILDQPIFYIYEN